MTTPLLRLARRVMMALGIGRQTADTDESTTTPTVQMVLPFGELRADVPVMQFYGFASRSVAGADLIAVYQSGDRNRGIVIASGDQRYRPRTIKPGEALLYNLTGSVVLLDAAGGIVLAPASNQAQVDGNLKVSGNLAVGTGASGSFTTPTGQVVTVQDGIVTNIF